MALLGEVEQYLSAVLGVGQRFLRCGERIGCGDWRMEFALGDQPCAGFQSLQDFGRMAKRWSIESEAANRHIAKDDVQRVDQPRFSARRGIDHHQASRSQAAGKKAQRFPSNSVER